MMIMMLFVIVDFIHRFSESRLLDNTTMMSCFVACFFWHDKIGYIEVFELRLRFLRTTGGTGESLCILLSAVL
jgi:hypothetical protein